MTETEIRNLVNIQKKYFKSNTTLPVKNRIEALKKLHDCIKKHETEISEALKKDLGKSTTEGFMCETGLALSEITYLIRHVKSYAKEKNVHTPLVHFHSRSYRKPSPYGVVLVMSPWNYPFLLTMEPLADAIAAGNTVIVKPSAYSPNTSEIIKKIIEECFTPEYVAVVTGGRAENSCLLNEHFDYIFFTGSKQVGKYVMEQASKHLTPVTLELGGKSPCIVDETANLKLAATRIVFGKYLNCGQTCVAPDYLYCHESVKDALLVEIKKQIVKQFGTDPLHNAGYGKIINKKHFDRINGLMEDKKVIHGGKSDSETLKIEPTIMDNISFNDAVMQEEIFGPLLPVLTFSSLDEAIDNVNSMDHPLALYLFSSNKNNIRRVTSECGYGGGCINDTIIHLASSELDFGGFGESGMGSYHGKFGFDTFTHYKSIVDKKTWIDLPMRYQPYKGIYEKMIRMFLK
ncbi:MAG: aldehyde dehydrogenase [Lachnospiraceae bacterium]